MAGSFTIEIDTKEIERFTNQTGKAAGITEGIMRTAMQQSLDVLLQIAVTETPVNTGLLRGSFTTDVRGRGVDMVGRMFSPLGYAAAVEHGRAAGRPPPIEAIRYWVIRKRIADEAEADSVAFLIARAIGRRGTKGAHMVKAAMDRGGPIVVRLWQDAMGKITGAMAR